MLSPGVLVGSNSVVKNSVIFHDVKIGRNCHVENAVLDKDVVLEDGVRVGAPPDSFSDPSGPLSITVVPKKCHLARGEVVTAGRALNSTLAV